MLGPTRRATALWLVAAACARSPAPATPPASARTNTPQASLRAAGSSASALAKIRPPPPPCLPSLPYAAPTALVERALVELDAGANDRALGCAEEALRLAPRLVPALSARADALAAAGRLDEARLAFARTLAIDPDDPETLLGAADLYVRRLGGDREALEVGLEYALRGARAVARAPRKDREVAARLELVAGVAENDIGRSHLALPHLDRAVAARPHDPDAFYERGLAFYELCRFGDAQKAFDRALQLAPDDPWTLHQLGLVAERRGDARRAESLLSRARSLAPEEFRADLPIDAAAFHTEVDGALATLPERERRALAKVPLQIQDLPDAADLLAVDPPLSPSILGLFRGPSEEEPCAASDGPHCRSIVVYRKNLLRFARDQKDLAEQVRVTLLHELGHLHGESDDELRARGLE